MKFQSAYQAQSVLQIKHTISEQQNSNKIRLKTPNKNYIAKNTFGSKRVRRPFRFQSRQNLKYSTNFLWQPGSRNRGAIKVETQKKFNSLTKFSVSSELSDFFLPSRCLSEKSHHRNLGGQKITFLCSQATSSLSLFWRLQVQTHTLLHALPTAPTHPLTSKPQHTHARSHCLSLSLVVIFCRWKSSKFIKLETKLDCHEKNQFWLATTFCCLTKF